MPQLKKEKWWSKDDRGKFQEMILREIFPFIDKGVLFNLLFEVWALDDIEDFSDSLLFKSELIREGIKKVKSRA